MAADPHRPARTARSGLAVLAALAGLATAGRLGFPAEAAAQISVSITVAPPALPVYDQPAIPGPGYIWTPGYWAWGDSGYYWVPGTWVEAPAPGLLWTPGYWGWSSGDYIWHAGYWGPHVGFYGGVNYGWGYGGSGYQGGYWDHGHFNYNQTVNNFGGARIANVYNRTVIINNSSHVSYNGGTGGIHALPTAAETAAAHERHLAATSAQVRHVRAARSEPGLRESVNHGHPAIAATSRPGAFGPRPQAAGGVVRRPADAAAAPHHDHAPAHGVAVHAVEHPGPHPGVSGGTARRAGARPHHAAIHSGSAAGEDRHGTGGYHTTLRRQPHPVIIRHVVHVSRPAPAAHPSAAHAPPSGGHGTERKHP